MKLTVKKPFSWAHRGIDVVEYQTGQSIETEDQDLIDVSTKEGWTVKGKGRGSAAESAVDAPAQQPDEQAPVVAAPEASADAQIPSATE